MPPATCTFLSIASSSAAAAPWAAQLALPLPFQLTRQV